MATRLHASPLFRKSVNKLAHWFFKDPKLYRKSLIEDIRIREILHKRLEKDSFIELVILRTPQQKITVKILTQKSDLIIQDENKLIKIKNEIKKVIDQDIVINIEDPEIPECYPRQYAIMLEQAILNKENMRIVIKKLFSQLRKTLVKGMRIVLSGRLSGSTMARKKIYSYGNVPKNTFSTYVNECTATANTTSGSCGIRVTLAMKPKSSATLRHTKPRRFDNKNHRGGKRNYHNNEHRNYNRNENNNEKTNDTTQGDN